MAVTNHSEGSRTRHTSHTPNRTIRLYGIPLLISGGTKTDTEEPHGTALGIVYCGFKADGNELRVPTGRVFSLRKDQVTESGEVADYVVSGETVYYYDVPFTAEVRESDSRRISLATEVITTTGGTFAGLVATPPIHTPMDLSTLEALSREELLDRVRKLMASEPLANKEGLPTTTSCEAYCQTYGTTWYGVGHREDAWGADCCLE